MALENQGGQELKKKKPSNTTKADSQIVQKFFICCFVAIRVQR
jgi:hypothetical protein